MNELMKWWKDYLINRCVDEFINCWINWIGKYVNWWRDDVMENCLYVNWLIKLIKLMNKQGGWMDWLMDCYIAML